MAPALSFLTSSNSKRVKMLSSVSLTKLFSSKRTVEVASKREDSASSALLSETLSAYTDKINHPFPSIIQVRVPLLEIESSKADSGIAQNAEAVDGDTETNKDTSGIAFEVRNAEKPHTDSKLINLELVQLNAIPSKIDNDEQSLDINSEKDERRRQHEEFQSSFLKGLARARSFFGGIRKSLKKSQKTSEHLHQGFANPGFVGDDEEEFINDHDHPIEEHGTAVNKASQLTATGDADAASKGNEKNMDNWSINNFLINTDKDTIKDLISFEEDTKNRQVSMRAGSVTHTERSFRLMSAANVLEMMFDGTPVFAADHVNNAPEEPLVVEMPDDSSTENLHDDTQSSIIQ